MVGTHRAGAVAEVSLEPHQGAVTYLFKRLELDPAARGVHGPGQIAVSRLRRADQVAQVHAVAFQL